MECMLFLLIWVNFLASNLQKMLKLVKIHEKMGQKCPKIGKIRQFLTKLPCVCEISAWSESFLPAKNRVSKNLRKKVATKLSEKTKNYALFR